MHVKNRFQFPETLALDTNDLNEQGQVMLANLAESAKRNATVSGPRAVDVCIRVLVVTMDTAKAGKSASMTLNQRPCEVACKLTPDTELLKISRSLHVSWHVTRNC